MNNTIFIIGAGFNADARRHFKILNESLSYPMVGDLASLCFGLAAPPQGVSIEDLFQDAIDRHDRAPLERLCNSIMKADYYLSDPEVHGEAPTPFYREFIDLYHDANFISFNYDGFLEILLMKYDDWRPDDGFGVPVKVDWVTPASGWTLPSKSRRLVLHLHGSLYIYTEEYQFSATDLTGTRWMQPLHEPQFLFDPDSTAHRFHPFARVQPGLYYEFVYDRIIAPVPDKATGRKEVFIRKTYEHAIRLLSTSQLTVSIGYRFSPADESSYAPLLNNLSTQRKSLVIVAPDAREIGERIAVKFGIDCIPIQCGFANWARSGFRI